MLKIWEFPRIRGTLFGALRIRILLLFRVLYSGPLFSETPIRSGLLLPLTLSEAAVGGFDSWP